MTAPPFNPKDPPVSDNRSQVEKGLVKPLVTPPAKPSKPKSDDRRKRRQK